MYFVLHEAQYRLVLFLLLAFMFRSPLFRVQRTASHLIKNASPALSSFSLSFSMMAALQQDDETMSDRLNGLIVKSGLELLTFGTPNGMVLVQHVGGGVDRVLTGMQATRRALSSKS